MTSRDIAIIEKILDLLNEKRKCIINEHYIINVAGTSYVRLLIMILFFGGIKFCISNGASVI